MASIINYREVYERDLLKLYSINHGLENGYGNTNSITEYIPDFSLLKSKLLRIKGRNKGYIIYNPYSQSIDSRIVNIDEMYIDRDYASRENYVLLLESVNRGIFTKRYKYGRIIFKINRTKKNELVSLLDLVLEKREYQMAIDLHRRVDAAENYDNIKFIQFKKGYDEGNRASIQNSIFKDTKGHVHCTISDIIREEYQDYYVEDGSTFLYIDGSIAGYSQIIMEKDNVVKPYIVNFGIHQNYRNKGLSRLLLSHTLGILQRKGFSRAYITVDGDNKKAYGLYKKAGFEKVSTLGSYLYRF